MFGKLEVTIAIDSDQLHRCSDAMLATYWHVAQANPAPHGDPVASELAEKIGFEIIRRWLKAADPELYHHRGADYYWDQLRKLAKYEPGSTDPRDADWHRGTWTPHEPAAETQGTSNGE